MKTIRSLLPLAFLLAAAGATPAPAQYSSQPQRITPVPVQPPVYYPPVAYCPPSNINVSLWTDRSFYDVGDELRLNVRVNQDAYVYIFNTDSCGVTRRIFPNPWDNDNYLQRGRTYRFPDRSRYAFLVEGPGGREELTVVAVSDHGGWIEQEYCRLDPRDPFPVVHGVEQFRVRFEASSRQGYEQWAGGFEYSSGGGPVAQPRSVRPVPVPPPPPVWHPPAYGEVTKWINVRRPILYQAPQPFYPLPPPRYDDSYFYFEYNSGRRDWESGWRDRQEVGPRGNDPRLNPAPSPHFSQEKAKGRPGS